MFVSERGAYAPPLHPRAGYASDQGEEPRRGAMLLAVTAAVVLALIGAVWSSYNQGVRVGGREAPPLIVASAEPYKVAPEDPGGATTDHLGVRVFDMLEEDFTPPGETRLGTAASEPVASEEAPGALFDPEGALRTEDPPEVAAPRLKPLPGAGRAAGAAAQGPLTLADVGSLSARRPLPPPAAPPERAPAAEPAAPSAPVTLTASSAPDPLATAASPPAGTFLVQIASYRSPDAAERGWLVFLEEHGDLVGAREPDVARADLGDVGVHYRLRVSGFDDREAAAAFCDRLKARGGECLVVSS